MIDEIDLRIERNELVPLERKSSAESHQQAHRSSDNANHNSLYEEHHAEWISPEVPLP